MRRVLTGFVNLAATEYPPYYGKDLEGHGFMTELIIEAFAGVGYDVTVKFLPWKRALESAKSGKYDGLFTVWYPRLEDNLIAGGYDA
jgi:polar amino acid transport system substrate-binding protein